MTKNMFFVIFSKMVIFGQKLTLPNVFLVKFPFLKCILLCIYFNELGFMSNTKFDKRNV